MIHCMILDASVDSVWVYGLPCTYTGTGTGTGTGPVPVPVPVPVPRGTGTGTLGMHSNDHSTVGENHKNHSSLNAWKKLFK